MLGRRSSAPIFFAPENGWELKDIFKSEPCEPRSDEDRPTDLTAGREGRCFGVLRVLVEHCLEADPPIWTSLRTGRASQSLRAMVQHSEAQMVFRWTWSIDKHLLKPQKELKLWGRLCGSRGFLLDVCSFWWFEKRRTSFSLLFLWKKG